MLASHFLVFSSKEKFLLHYLHKLEDTLQYDGILHTTHKTPLK